MNSATGKLSVGISWRKLLEGDQEGAQRARAEKRNFCQHAALLLETQGEESTAAG